MAHDYESPEFMLVREAVESAFSPSVARDVLDAAREASRGRSPRNVSETLAFVDGPLRLALGRQVDEASASTIIQPLLEMLGGAAHDDFESDPITMEIAPPTDPALVWVISESDETVDAISAAFTRMGSRRPSLFRIVNEDVLVEARVLREPSFIVVDAAAFAPIEPEDLAALISAHTIVPTVVVLGRELPYAQSLIEEFRQRGVENVTLDRIEGIAPLVDLVRALGGGR